MKSLIRQARASSVMSLYMWLWAGSLWSSWVIWSFTISRRALGELIKFMMGKVYSCWSNTTYPPDGLGPRQTEENIPIPASSLGRAVDQTLTLKHRLFFHLSNLASFSKGLSFQVDLILNTSVEVTLIFFPFLPAELQQRHPWSREAAQMFRLLEPLT